MLPILEEMACQTTVVSPGAALELFAGGGGVLVRHKGPVDMAKAIVRVCTLPEHDWQLMSARARATAEMAEWAASVDLFEQSHQDAVTERGDR